MDQLTPLEKEALKLPPEERLQRADTIHASLAMKQNPEWESKVSAEFESRWEAYKAGAIGSSEGLGFLGRIESGGQ